LTESRLLTPSDVRRLAGEIGVRPSKQRGQNFVIDPNTIRKIIRASGLGPDDVVVEIGPGLGSLTLGLAGVARRVVAVEIEAGFVARLPATIEEFAPGADVEVVHADALKVTELSGDEPTALVANLPYNISVPVLLHFLERFRSIRRGLVLVQAEVADRLVAGPGSRTYGVPSVKAAWYAELRAAGTVSRGVFWPVPNVDSKLVAWERHPEPGDENLRRREPGRGRRRACRSSCRS
jgi:16S rRNA (adenine1518-N6/adenine1519-N6)-dimethyltransferase